MNQKFYAHPTDTFTSPNGAIGHRIGGPMDCLGPYAKVRNCPIAGTSLRLTCYATGYADTWFSVPACTQHRGRYISGYFTSDDDGVIFMPMNRHREYLRHAYAITPRLCQKAMDDCRYATHFANPDYPYSLLPGQSTNLFNTLE